MSAGFDYEEDDATAVELAVGALDNQLFDDEMVEQTFYDQQQQLQQQANLAASIPEPVRNYLLYFAVCVKENNAYELHGCYETTFNRLTEKFYKTAPWPDPDMIVAPLVNHDHIFLTLYKELYFRHIYAKLQPSLEQRFASYENYVALFNLILNAEGPLDLELPTYWAWDIIDEFIYQFNSFAIHRSRVARKGGPMNEMHMLQDNASAWACYSVLNVLYSLIQRSQINEQLAAIKKGADPNEVAGNFGTFPLYRMLGYFSIIGLLRVHCLLGDFTLALQTLDDIELNKKALFARVTAAHFTTYYYVGFSYMMMRRYSDAIKAFSHILLFISRTKNYHNRNAQYDIIAKKSDQMYALLAVCVALCPTRLDDTIHTNLREKFGEQFSRLQRGGPDALPVYEELFLFACPKFITPTIPDYDNPESNAEQQQHHLKIFIGEISSNLLAPTLRSYLKLYTSMNLDKLAGFLESDTEKLRSQLIILKQKSREIKWTDGGLLRGEVTHASDLDFSLQKDLIHIAERKVGRRYADWFLRNAAKFYVIQETMEV